MKITDIIDGFVNDGETFAIANRMTNALKEVDVYYINELGAPHYWNAQFLYKVIASTNKRVIANTVVDSPNWQQYFDRVGVMCFDIEKDIVVLEMQNDNSHLPTS